MPNRRDRPAINDVVITPAMIEAGAVQISRYGRLVDAEELARRVYTAMLERRSAVNRQNNEHDSGGSDEP